MEEEIEQIVRSRPLIGDRESGLSSLESELGGNAGFVRKLPVLGAKYSGIRRVRGDGNCFYRGFAFRYLEIILEDDAERSRVLDVLKDSLKYLLEAGYEEVSIETFCDFAVETVEKCRTQAELEELFSDEGESDYFVWFARLASAGFLKRNAERFFPFLPETFSTVEEFCSKEVEPMNKECEQLQVIALSDYLGVKVRIEYLDASDSDQTSTHTFGPEGSSSAACVDLLYRPSHYDILYP